MAAIYVKILKYLEIPNSIYFNFFPFYVKCRSKNDKELIPMGFSIQ